MGYWRQGADGSSLHAEETGLVWGDAPADIFGQAVDDIVEAFKSDLGRLPKKAEIEAGLKFTLGRFDGEEVPGDSGV